MRNFISIKHASECQIVMAVGIRGSGDQFYCSQ